MMEVLETTGAVRCAKLQSNCHHQCHCCFCFTFLLCICIFCHT